MNSTDFPFHATSCHCFLKTENIFSEALTQKINKIIYSDISCTTNCTHRRMSVQGCVRVVGSCV